jgi:hypothetical protein
VKAGSVHCHEELVLVAECIVVLLMRDVHVTDAVSDRDADAA